MISILAYSAQKCDMLLVEQNKCAICLGKMEDERCNNQGYRVGLLRPQVQDRENEVVRGDRLLRYCASMVLPTSYSSKSASSGTRSSGDQTPGPLSRIFSKSFSRLRMGRELVVDLKRRLELRCWVRDERF
ncbi:hypothetical protein U1Q18_006024 [Sarracenia purpurea var. burkii]